MATALRNFRASDDLWEASKKAAEARNENVSAAITRFLTIYAWDFLHAPTDTQDAQNGPEQPSPSSEASVSPSGQ